MKFTAITFFLVLPIALLSQHSHCEHACDLGINQTGPRFMNTWTKANHAHKSNGLTHFIGSTHQHSGFSDGFPGTTPANYFESGKQKGFDFVFGADHSDSYLLPVTLHDNCASEDLLNCIAIDPLNLLGSILKWPEFESIKDEFTDSSFTPVRGF